MIVLSCHDEFEYVKKAMKEGADEYVLKNTLNEESLYTVLEATEEHIRQSKEEAGVKDQKQQTQEHADMKRIQKKITMQMLTGKRERSRIRQEI